MPGPLVAGKGCPEGTA